MIYGIEGSCMSLRDAMTGAAGGNTCKKVICKIQCITPYLFIRTEKVQVTEKFKTSTTLYVQTLKKRHSYSLAMMPQSPRLLIIFLFVFCFLPMRDSMIY